MCWAICSVTWHITAASLLWFVLLMHCIQNWRCFCLFCVYFKEWAFWSVPSSRELFFLSVSLCLYIYIYSLFVCNLTVSWVVFPYPSLVCVHTSCVCCNSFVLKLCMFLTSFEIFKLSTCYMSILGMRHLKAYIMKSEYLLSYCIVFTNALYLA